MSTERLFRATGAALVLLIALGVGGAGPRPARAQGEDPDKDRLPRLEKTGVLVPWEDFKKILEEIRGAHPAPIPAPPPVEYALSACQASVTVSGDEGRAVVRLEFGVQVLARDAWVEVPVITEGVALSRFDIDGRPADVYRKNGSHNVALRGEGRHTLVLEYLAQVSDGGGSHSTILRFPQAPVIALDLSVPRPKLDVTLPGAVVRSIERLAGQTRVRAAYQQASDAYVSWSKEIELGEKETKISGELRTLLSIGEGMLRGTATAVYTIHGRGVDTFRVSLPAGITVLDVGAQGVRDWTVEEGKGTRTGSEPAPGPAAGQGAGPGAGGGRVLVVRLNYLAQGGYQFQVSYEQEIKAAESASGAAGGAGAAAEGAGPAAEGAAGARGAGGAAAAPASGVDIAAPDLALLDVARDKGFIAVAAATNVEINPAGDLKNATPIDPAELPPEIAALSGQPVLYGFKYLQHPVGIGLKIVKHDDLAVKRTIVESARLYTYLSPEGHLITAARYTVKNNRKQYLELAMPEGAEPWGAYLEDQPVKAARSAEGKVLVPLKKTAVDAAGDLPPFDVELVYFQRRAAGLLGRHRFAAPALDVDVMEVDWHLFLPRDRRYGAFGGNLRPDDELNTVVYLQGRGFNLKSRADAQELGYLAGAAGEEASQVKDEERDANALLRQLADKRERLENELKKVGGKAVAGILPQSVARSDQVSNVAAAYGGAAQAGFRGELEGGVEQGVAGGAPRGVVGGVIGGLTGGAGFARGVLPVRFSIPTDGLRLSFSGRLLTANERPRISLSYWPLAWTLPASGVFLLALLLTLAILALRARPPAAGSPLTGGRRTAAAWGAALALFILYALNSSGRCAFWLGLGLAVVGFLAAHLWSARSQWLGRAAGLLILAALPAAAIGAAALAASASPAFAADAARRELPDLHKTEITLSWQDFKALVEKTFVPPVVEPEPPAESFLRSAEYTGRLEPGVLTLDGTLALEVLKKGWTRLPLPSQGTVLAFQGGGALLNRNQGSLEVLARGPASYTLKVSLAFNATGNPGENRLSVSLPEAPRNLLDLGAAPMFRELQVEGGLAYGGRQGRLFVALPRGGFSMKYTLPFRRAEERAGAEVKLEPRVQAAEYQLLRLGDGVVSGALIHDYTVRVAKVDHFDIDLPEGVVVFDAAAPGLESWKILQRAAPPARADGPRFLRVKLLAPVEGRVRVVVNFEGAYDAKAGELAVPRFAPQGVERESGFVAVAAEGAEVELALSGRLLPADVSEIPPDVAAYGGSLISACKYSGAPDAATVKITEHEDAPVLTAIIESLNATTALLENGTEATWVDLSIKNNRKQFLNLTLPGKEVEIWSLLLDGQPAKPKRTGDTVLVPLPRGDGERTSGVSLVLLRKGPEVRPLRRIEPRLPRLDIPVSEALWTVYLPEGNRYVVSGDRFRPVVETAPLLAGGGRRAGVFSDKLGPIPPQELSSKVVAEAAPAAVQKEMRLQESEDLGTQEGATAEEGRYLSSVSGSTARAQLEQEARVAEQFRAKASARKGSLPVHIVIPGGVARLPRVTVGRMLIVAGDDNTFSLRAYPDWLGAALAMLQRILIGGAGVLIGLVLAGVMSRRLLVRAALPAALVGLLPLGPAGPISALFFIALLAGLTWAAALGYRLLRPRLAIGR